MPLPSLLSVFFGGEITDLVLQTGAVAKTVLLILLSFSILSWAIILSKWSLLQLQRRLRAYHTGFSCPDGGQHSHHGHEVKS